MTNFNDKKSIMQALIKGSDDYHALMRATTRWRMMDMAGRRAPQAILDLFYDGCFAFRVLQIKIYENQIKRWNDGTINWKAVSRTITYGLWIEADICYPCARHLNLFVSNVRTRDDQGQLTYGPDRDSWLRVRSSEELAYTDENDEEWGICKLCGNQYAIYPF